MLAVWQGRKEERGGREKRGEEKRANRGERGERRRERGEEEGGGEKS